MSGSAPRHPWLFDPRLGGQLVRAHRPVAAGPAGIVVSDEVWRDVLGVLRWADATACCRPGLSGGAAWRTASAAAALLRRMPGVCDEFDMAWPGVNGPTDTVPVPAGLRLRAAADRLALRLCSPEQLFPGGGSGVLAGLAEDVDEVGAAAIAVLAAGADWTAAG